MFGTTAAAAEFVADDDANRRLSDRVQDLWVSFARGEEPSSDGLAWPLYDAESRATLILDPDLRVESDPYAGTREAWGEVRFDGSDPGLDRLTPLQFEGTPTYHPLVIAMVIGWQWFALGAVVVAALVVGIVLLVRRKRRSRATAADQAVA